MMWQGCDLHATHPMQLGTKKMRQKTQKKPKCKKKHEFSTKLARNPNTSHTGSRGVQIGKTKKKTKKKTNKKTANFPKSTKNESTHT